jgi:hypothetical protein
MISWKLLGFWIVRADVVMTVSFGSLSLVRLAAAVTWTLDRSKRGACSITESVKNVRSSLNPR